MGNKKVARFENYKENGEPEILEGIVVSENPLQVKVGDEIYTPRNRAVKEIREIHDERSHPDGDER